MKKRCALFVTAVFGVSMLGGCYTTTVDQGPPKIGQTVDRPNPAAKTMAENHANEMQQETSTSSTVVPGNNPEPAPAMGNSIFTDGVVSNPSTAGANMPAENPNAITNGTVVPLPANQNTSPTAPAQTPAASPLTPTNSNAPIKDGG